MEMILSHDDLMNADYSNRVKGCGWTSQSVIGGFLLGVLAGPGAASAQKQVFSSFEFAGFQQLSPHSFEAVEVAPAVVAVAELITRIKECWQFNMTEVAEILGVTRPTVYSWLNGKTSPDAGKIQRLQILAAAASIWAEQTQGKNWDYIIDYTGPRADELSIRDHLKSGATTTDQLRELIPKRIAQFQQAYTESRKLLGDPPPPPKTAPPESARRMNALWAKNAKKLHAARNRDR